MNGAPEIVIDVNGLTKRFGSRTVVRDLSMKVRRGRPSRSTPAQRTRQ